eukprot:4092427-Alexandrium_andersonii.AAC.1
MAPDGLPDASPTPDAISSGLGALVLPRACVDNARRLASSVAETGGGDDSEVTTSTVLAVAPPGDELRIEADAAF